VYWIKGRSDGRTLPENRKDEGRFVRTRSLNNVINGIDGIYKKYKMKHISFTPTQIFTVILERNLSSILFQSKMSSNIAEHKLFGKDTLSVYARKDQK